MAGGMTRGMPGGAAGGTAGGVAGGVTGRVCRGVRDLDDGELDRVHDKVDERLERLREHGGEHLSGNGRCLSRIGAEWERA